MSEKMKPSSWLWPVCGNSKTLSFRAEKIMDSVPIEPESERESATSTVSVTELEENEDKESGGAESIENVIRGLRSERLFFEPGKTTSSIIGEQIVGKSNTERVIESGEGRMCTDEPINSPIKVRTRVMEMDSKNPFMDFKRSMEEMVEAHGLNLKDWEGLQELLKGYLMVNGKCNHGYIVGAFLDLLVDLDFSAPVSSSSCDDDDDDGDHDSPSSTTNITQSSISALSFSSSTFTKCLSTLEEALQEKNNSRR